MKLCYSDPPKEGQLQQRYVYILQVTLIYWTIQDIVEKQYYFLSKKYIDI